jgi:hypothetical protein
LSNQSQKYSLHTIMLNKISSALQCQYWNSFWLSHISEAIEYILQYSISSVWKKLMKTDVLLQFFLFFDVITIFFWYVDFLWLIYSKHKSIFLLFILISLSNETAQNLHFSDASCSLLHRKKKTFFYSF